MNEQRNRSSMTGACMLLALAGGCGPPQSEFISGPTEVSSLVIEGPSTMDPGTAATFRAVLTFYPDPDKKTRDVSQEAQWTTTAASVLSIDRGVATAHAAGVATVGVRLPDGMSQSRLVSVGPPAPVQPPTLAVGETVSGTLGPFMEPYTYLLTPTADGTLVVRLSWPNPYGDSALALKVDDTEFRGQPEAVSPIVARLPVRSGAQYRITVTLRYAESVTPDFVLTTAIE